MWLHCKPVLKLIKIRFGYVHLVDCGWELVFFTDSSTFKNILSSSEILGKISNDNGPFSVEVDGDKFFLSEEMRVVVGLYQRC